MAAIVAVSAIAIVALMRESKETQRHKQNRHRPKGQARSRYGHMAHGATLVEPFHQQEFNNDERVNSMDPRVVTETHERDKDERRRLETLGTDIPK